MTMGNFVWGIVVGVGMTLVFSAIVADYTSAWGYVTVGLFLMVIGFTMSDWASDKYD